MNRDNAFNLALLLHFHRVDPVEVLDLYTTLCNFSYKGDIRMRWKMENPNKVKNIVLGSLAGLHEIYIPRLQKSEEEGFLKIIEWNEDDTPKLIQFRHAPDNL